MMLFIDNKHLNELMRKSIRQLVSDAKQASHATITMRVEGRDYVYQADWLKHLQFPKYEREVADRMTQPKPGEGSNATDIQPK